MINITNQKRDEIYEQSDPSIKKMYGSAESGKVLMEIFQKTNLEMSLYENYVFTIGDTILGFHQTTELPRLFQTELGIGADQAQRLLSELSEFLAPVIAREGEGAKIKKEELDKLAKTFADTKNRPKEIRPEGQPADVKPLRTMEGDINRIHGYGAYRAQESANPQTPTATPTATPATPVTAKAPAASPATPTPPATAAPTNQPVTEDEPVYKAKEQADILTRPAQPIPSTNPVPSQPTTTNQPPRSAADYLMKNNQSVPATNKPADPATPTAANDHSINQIPLKKIE